MLPMLPVLAICLLFVYVLPNGALAQGLFKCTVNGKVTYGQQPCANGKSVELAVPPAPMGSDPASELARQKALLATLQKERALVEAREQREWNTGALARAGNVASAAARKQRCDKLRLQKKWADEDLARAAGPATEPLRLKARRQAEVIAVECPP